MTPSELRPLGPAQVIDVAVRLVRRHFKEIATILAATWLPWAVLQPLVLFIMADDLVLVDGQPRPVYSTDAAEGVASLIDFMLVLGSLLATAVVIVAMVRHLAAAYADMTFVPWPETLRFGLGRLGAVIWLFVLLLAAWVGTGLALFLLAQAIGPIVLLAAIPLLIWLLVAWSVVIPALVVEDERGVAALSRSFRLVRGRWWPTFGALIVAFIVLFAVQLGLSLLLVGVLAIDDAAVVLALATIVGVAINFVVYPFWAAVQTVIYYDLRVRKEGLDLHRIADGLRPGEPAPAPPLPGPPYAAPGPAAPGVPAPPPLPPRREDGAIGLPTPAPEGYVACSECGRHRAADIAACPFCGSALGG